MSVLGRGRLNALLCHENITERLIMTPLLSREQIGDASIDIRMGSDFIVTKRGNLAKLDPAKDEVRERRYQTKHFVNFGDCFYLHPNELVLAGTLEYFRLPTNVAATVTSRSQWGRAGLVIATATAVHPGFSGSITLELLNLGEVPLVLYPGSRVAQIVFFDCDGGTPYQGDMAHKTGAHFPGLANSAKTADTKYWSTPRKPI